MKWMIASDLHGSAAYTGKLLKRFEEEKADRLLLLGDYLYHGPRNDLPGEYDTRKTANLLNGYKDRILAVRGNCDAEVDQVMLEFPIQSDYLLIEDSGLTIFATHGHLYSENHLPPLGNIDILIHGHTHIPVCDVQKDYICLNPGSVSIPKGDSTHSYMTLENGLFLWKDLDGTEYHRFEK